MKKRMTELSDTIVTIKHGAKRVVILSNDNNTLILLLRYIDGLMKSGLEGLFLQYGPRKSHHMTPLHVCYTERSIEWCRILTEVQVLTRNNFVSITGTKLAVIKLNPLKNLSGYGEIQSITKADMFFLLKSTQCLSGMISEALLQLKHLMKQMEMHTRSTFISLDKLSPTSSVIKKSLKRGFAEVTDFS